MSLYYPEGYVIHNVLSYFHIHNLALNASSIGHHSCYTRTSHLIPYSYCFFSRSFGLWVTSAPCLPPLIIFHTTLLQIHHGVIGRDLKVLVKVLFQEKRNQEKLYLLNEESSVGPLGPQERKIHSRPSSNPPSHHKPPPDQGKPWLTKTRNLKWVLNVQGKRRTKKKRQVLMNIMNSSRSVQKKNAQKRRPNTKRPGV